MVLSKTKNDMNCRIEIKWQAYQCKKKKNNRISSNGVGSKTLCLIHLLRLKKKILNYMVCAFSIYLRNNIQQAYLCVCVCVYRLLQKEWCVLLFTSQHNKIFLQDYEDLTRTSLLLLCCLQPQTTRTTPSVDLSISKSEWKPWIPW